MWIDEWLFKNGMSQKGLADILEINRSHLSAVINGLQPLSKKLALQIQDISGSKLKAKALLKYTSKQIRKRKT